MHFRCVLVMTAPWHSGETPQQNISTAMLHSCCEVLLKALCFQKKPAGAVARQEDRWSICPGHVTSEGPFCVVVEYLFPQEASRGGQICSDVPLTRRLQICWRCFGATEDFCVWMSCDGRSQVLERATFIVPYNGMNILCLTRAVKTSLSVGHQMVFRPTWTLK